MDNELLKGLKKAIEEGKVAFDASREQSKERRIKEENDDPIMFVFPEQKELPEHIRAQVDNFTGVMKDLFGNITSDLNTKTADKKDDTEGSTSETLVGEFENFTGKLSEFALFEGDDKFTLLVPSVGLREDDFSIKFVGDDLLIYAESASHGFNPTGYRMIAGTLKSLISPLRVRLSVPDVDHEKTTFNLANGLLTVELFKVDKAPNVFIVK